MKMEQTECSKTLAYKIQTPGNYPEESTWHSKHSKSLKSRMFKNKYQQKQSTLTGLGDAPFFNSCVAKLPSSYSRDVSKANQRAVWPSSVRIFKSTGCEVRFRRREKTVSLRAITARWRGVLPIKDTKMLKNQVVKAWDILVRSILLGCDTVSLDIWFLTF